MIEYEDFSIKIEPLRGDIYPVIVLHSPAGEGRSSFRLPFDPEEIGGMLFDLGQSVRGSKSARLREVAPGATRTRPQQIGDQLFNALFSGVARSLLDQSLGMIRERQCGLRIKLHIDPEDASLSTLSSLPWELMYRKETRDFLNLSRSTPVLRYLDVQRPYLPLPLELPLRILIVISSPVDCRQLDLERERGQIERTLAMQEGVAVDFVETATVIELQDRLAEQRYHVLHYMGHGAFDRHSGRGVLVLEDKEGFGAPVDGSTLGVLLRDVSTMRLVFLNACETARVSQQVGLDPFAGVASAMVMAGIPAVLAMQFPITDQAAICFANRFYQLLARGHPVDYVVAEGRKAIRLSETDTMEWVTPVLFMRAPEGILFEVTEAKHADHDRLLPAAERKLEDLTTQTDLDDLYSRALLEIDRGRWEEAQKLLIQVESQEPGFHETVRLLAEAEAEISAKKKGVAAGAAAGRPARSRAATWASAIPRTVWVLGAALVAVMVVVWLVAVVGGSRGDDVVSTFEAQTAVARVRTGEVVEAGIALASAATQTARAQPEESNHRDVLFTDLANAQAEAVRLLQSGESGAAQVLIEQNLSAIDEALRRYPNDAEFHALMGYTLKDMYQSSRGSLPDGQRQAYLGRARACFEHALRLDPNSASAHNGMGNVLFFEGRFDDAIQEHNTALELTGDNYPAAAHDRDLVIRVKNGEIPFDF